MCLVEVFELVRVLEFVVLQESFVDFSVEGFGFELLEVLDDFVDLSIDYGHFLIKNQFKSK